MKLLSDVERQRIETAIGELERHTAAEVVVAVVGRSTQTFLPRVLVGLAVSLTLGLLFLERWPRLDPRWSLVVELMGGFATFLLLGLTGLERRLVARHAARHEVLERAFALFTRRGLHRTRGHTGVLLLISELERQVVILGDAGIHGRLGESGWQAHVDHVIAAIQRGEAARGILEVLERLGAVLAELAPPDAQNDDELPNAVIEEP